MKILIVEPNHTEAEKAKVALHGHKVTIAVCVKQATDLIEDFSKASKPFEAVLTNLDVAFSQSFNVVQPYGYMIALFAINHGATFICAYNPDQDAAPNYFFDRLSGFRPTMKLNQATCYFGSIPLHAGERNWPALLKILTSNA